MCLSRFAALAARIIVLLQEGNVGLALSSQTPASNLHWLTLAELASLSLTLTMGLISREQTVIVVTR